MKRCTKCNCEKDAWLFHRCAKARDGLKGVCKECASKIAAERYIKNRTDILKKTSAYAKANPEKRRKHVDKYRFAHADDVLARGRRYEAANKEKRREKFAEYWQKNSEKLKAAAKKWRSEKYQSYRAKNIDRIRAHARKYAKTHRDKMAAQWARRKAAVIGATPSWANEFFISEAYSLARKRTALLGFKWNVDHIVPLVSKYVCGLHVENNLSVIPYVENVAKGNRKWPDMAEEK